MADEFGIIQGLVTTHDLLEAIAGDFPDENEGRFIEPIAGGWSAEGAADLFLVEQTTQVSGLRPENGSCATLAGLLLEKFGRIPTAGESITFSGLRFDVVKATRSRIERVRIPELMRTDGLYAHKVRSQQGGCETALLRYFKQVKGEQPFEQCGFTDDMDCQSCPDLGLKCVEYGQISAQYIQDAYIFTYYTSWCGYLQVLSDAKKILSLIILKIFITS